MEEKIEFIDSVLSTLEDIIKGQNGDNITIARGELHELLSDAEQEKHSYAARFAEWCSINQWIFAPQGNNNLWFKFGDSDGNDKTTSQLLALFNEQDKMEKK